MRRDSKPPSTHRQARSELRLEAKYAVRHSATLQSGLWRAALAAHVNTFFSGHNARVALCELWWMLARAIFNALIRRSLCTACVLAQDILRKMSVLHTAQPWAIHIDIVDYRQQVFPSSAFSQLLPSRWLLIVCVNNAT